MDAYREGHEFSSVISGGKKVATNIEWSAEEKLTRLQRNGNGKSCLAPVLRPGPLSTVIESYLDRPESSWNRFCRLIRRFRETT